jgi:hypothetical protein
MSPPSKFFQPKHQRLRPCGGFSFALALTLVSNVGRQANIIGLM